MVTGACGGVHDPWALVRTVHCVAQAGRFDARRVTAWAEMIGVREKIDAMRKDLIVGERVQCERMACAGYNQKRRPGQNDDEEERMKKQLMN